MDLMESQQKNKKKCTKCGIVLEAVVGNFYKDSQKVDGLSSSCADCCRKTKRKTYELVTSKRLKKERIVKKELYLKSNDYLLVLQERKIREKERKKKWRDKNKEIINEKERNRPKRNISKEKKLEYKKTEYKKMMSCPYKKHVHYSRVKINDLLRQGGGGKKFSISGCILFSKEEFISHIESLFIDGMSWDNYGRGGWHIDHIKPIACFDITNEEDVKVAFSLSNLQPLFESENCSKGSFYNGKRYNRGKK